MQTLLSISSFLLGVWVLWIELLIALAIIGPFIAPKLLNDPNRLRGDEEDAKDYKPSTFGYFTKIEPGMMKIIVRLGRFVRVMMERPGSTFEGYKRGSKLRPRNDAFWEAVDAPSNEPDVHPIPFRIWDGIFGTITWFALFPFHLPWWLWKRWIYTWTGCVFTGIWPFQTLRIYPIERFKEVTDGEGKITLVRKRDYSDFYYVKEFTFWVPIASADTKDGARTNIFLMLVMAVHNAFELAFLTDPEWSSRVLGMTSSAINDVTRQYNLRDVIASGGNTNEVKIALEKSITDENLETGELGRIGLHVFRVQLPDRSTTSGKLAESMEDEVKADFDAAAATKRARGTAATITETANAIQKAGASGVMAAGNDTRVRLAQAAGDRAIITISDSDNRGETLLAAILKQGQSQGA